MRRDIRERRYGKAKFQPFVSWNLLMLHLPFLSAKKNRGYLQPGEDGV